MRHRNKGRKLGRTRSHRKATLSNLATALIVHKRIQTTEAKAKELRPFVEKLITRATRARVREDNDQLTGNQTIDIHARRVVYKVIRDKSALEELFDNVALTIIDKGDERKGGYTRITKIGTRRGDASPMAVIELVDWGEERDGAVTQGRRKKARRTASSKSEAASQEAAAQAEEVQEAIQDSLENAMATLADDAEKSDADSDDSTNDGESDEKAKDDETKS